MNQKGQLSFDLYFAIMFAIIISQQLFIVSDQFSGASNETSILAQEKQVANNVAAILSSSAALNEGKDFSIEYAVPTIFDIEKRGPQTCEITIDSATGLVSVFYPTKDASKASATASGLASKPIKINTPAGMQLAPPYAFKCGDKIIIKKA